MKTKKEAKHKCNECENEMKHILEQIEIKERINTAPRNHLIRVYERPNTIMKIN